jgi:aryl-alcohol dehydrogenase-like predicted oxidoreductase
LIAKAIKGRRDDVVIHSKLGSIRPDGVNVVSGTPDHIRASTEGGLKRLGIDCLDVICISRVDPVVPVEESVAAMAEMVKEGKTRYIAISKGLTPELLDRAWSVHPVIAVQDEYSLFVRDPEDGVLPACREHGMGFTAFAPLGRGILAGLFHSASDIPEGDRRQKDKRYQGDNLARNVEILKGLEAVAADKGASVSALALAWVMHQEGAVIPIPSSKSRNHLEENVVAAEMSLSAEDLARIGEICPRDAVAGVSNHAPQAAAS